MSAAPAPKRKRSTDVDASVKKVKSDVKSDVKSAKPPTKPKQSLPLLKTDGDISTQAEDAFASKKYVNALYYYEALLNVLTPKYELSYKSGNNHKAIEISHAILDCHVQMGRSYYAIGKLPESKSAFDKAIGIISDTKESMAEFGDILSSARLYRSRAIYKYYQNAKAGGAAHGSLIGTCCLALVDLNWVLQSAIERQSFDDIGGLFYKIRFNIWNGLFNYVGFNGSLPYEPPAKLDLLWLCKREAQTCQTLIKSHHRQDPQSNIDLLLSNVDSRGKEKHPIVNVLNTLTDQGKMKEKIAEHRTEYLSWKAVVV